MSPLRLSDDNGIAGAMFRAAEDGASLDGLEQPVRFPIPIFAAKLLPVARCGGWGVAGVRGGVP